MKNNLIDQENQSVYIPPSAASTGISRFLEIPGWR
jgi:hypothetical protein